MKNLNSLLCKWSRFDVVLSGKFLIRPQKIRILQITHYFLQDGVFFIHGSKWTHSTSPYKLATCSTTHTGEQHTH